MDTDTSENSTVPLEKTSDELQRSRSPLETVTEEVEGYQPILVTPNGTEWKSVPLLVEDSSRVLLAPSLQLALRHFFTNCGRDVTEISRSDLMIVLIYVIALETGLIPKGCSLPSQCLQEKLPIYRAFDRRLVYHFANRLPLDWFRNRTVPYRFELELVHERARCDGLSCTVVALTSGDLFIVNLLPHQGTREGFSVTVPISFHVPSVNANRLPLCYQNLAAVSFKLKNQLFVPFRSHMYAKFVPVMNPSLRGVPQDVISKVMAYLDEQSRRKLVDVLLPATDSQ